MGDTIGLIHTETHPLPDGFRETNAGLIVPADLSRERETWTEEEARILYKATAIVNAHGWYLAFGCPHERCKAQPIVGHAAVAGGMELQCQHKTATVRKPPPGKPNVAVQRRLQSRRDRQEERNRVVLAKAINDATAPKQPDSTAIDAPSGDA
jgi:hypothetical protein